MLSVSLVLAHGDAHKDRARGGDPRVGDTLRGGTFSVLTHVCVE